jgi:hypothetical protein
VLWLTFGVFLAGCNRRDPVVSGTDWQPQCIGGPIEIRPLPPVSEVQANYNDWVRSGTGKKCRLYEVSVSGSTNQLQFVEKIGRGDTPMGATDVTRVSFIYKSATNGDYFFVWSLTGGHATEFLRLGSRPKTFWVAPLSSGGTPKLRIEAVEGVKPWQTLIAER